MTKNILENGLERLALINSLEEFVLKFNILRRWREGTVAVSNKYSEVEVSILQLLENQPGLAAKNLVKALNKPFSSIAPAQTRLEKDGLIEVKRDGNKRSLPIFLTELGMERMNEIRWHRSFGTARRIVNGEVLLGPIRSVHDDNLPGLHEAIKHLIAQEDYVIKQLFSKESVI